ncbi:MAG: hypothetical protein ACRC62_22980 [Microcoleus sp.]
MRTPAYSILENLIEDTGAAVGLIYGYSSDRSRIRLVSSIGADYKFPDWDTVGDCWLKRLEAHEQNAPYEIFVSQLADGPCRQRYLDIGCDYSLSYPIIRHGRLCGFVAALWRSIPTISSSHRNRVARASLDLAEIVDDAGYPKKATDDELTANLKSVAAEFASICKIQIGIDREQRILYWRDIDDFFGFGSNPPLNLSLGQIFTDPGFGEVHQKLVEKFLDGDTDYRPMNVSRQIEVKGANGERLRIVIGLLRRVSAHNTYGALALGFPVKLLVGGSLVPDEPGDERSRQIERHLDTAISASKKLDQYWKGGLVVALWVAIGGLLFLGYQGKLPGQHIQSEQKK